jgi:hypothetical protein
MYLIMFLKASDKMDLFSYKYFVTGEDDKAIFLLAVQEVSSLVGGAYKVSSLDTTSKRETSEAVAS